MKLEVALSPIDTLPGGCEWAATVPYENYHFRTKENYAICRFWGGESGRPPLIVVTDSDQGTSITNRAERIHYLAWEAFEKPWPVRFFEHYRGEDSVMQAMRRRNGLPPLPHPQDPKAEHIDEVIFDGTGGDGPILKECWSGGVVVGLEFVNAEWRPFSLARFAALVKGVIDE